MEFDLDICHYLRKNIEYMPRRHNPHLTYVKTVEPNLTAAFLDLPSSDVLAFIVQSTFNTLVGLSPC